MKKILVYNCLIFLLGILVFFGFLLTIELIPFSTSICIDYNFTSSDSLPYRFLNEINKDKSLAAFKITPNSLTNWKLKRIQPKDHRDAIRFYIFDYNEGIVFDVDMTYDSYDDDSFERSHVMLNGVASMSKTLLSTENTDSIIIAEEPVCNSVCGIFSSFSGSKKITEYFKKRIIDKIGQKNDEKYVPFVHVQLLNYFLPEDIGSEKWFIARMLLTASVICCFVLIIIFIVLSIKELNKSKAKVT